MCARTGNILKIHNSERDLCGTGELGRTFNSQHSCKALISI